MNIVPVYMPKGGELCLVESSQPVICRKGAIDLGAIDSKEMFLAVSLYPFPGAHRITVEQRLCYTKVALDEKVYSGIYFSLKYLLGTPPTDFIFYARITNEFPFNL